MLKAHDAVLSAREATLEIGGRKILDRVSMDVRPGEIVTVIGPNGAGKSTLVRCMLGLQPLTSGRIIRRPGLRVGYVPQRFPLTPNVPLDVRRLLTLTIKADDAEIEAALRETGIAHLKHRPASRGSRAANCSVPSWRAPCCASPSFWCSTNPCRPSISWAKPACTNSFPRSARRHGCGILMVSHDLHMVMAESDHVICLNGHVCCEGAPTKVQQDPEFAQALRAIRRPHDRRLHPSPRS